MQDLFSDNSDLNIKINKDDFCSATVISKKGFGLCWAGARATYGVTAGRVCFEVRVDGNCDIDEECASEPTPYALRYYNGTICQL